MSSYSEFHVEFNGYSPINRNDPQPVEIFGPASLKKDVNKSLAEFTSVFAQSEMAPFGFSIWPFETATRSAPDHSDWVLSEAGSSENFDLP